MALSKKLKQVSMGLCIVIIGLFVILLVNRINNKPILIGFAAQLTGRQAELGIQERNGVQLAVEMINAGGGIGGRNIELLIRDDLGKPDMAQVIDRELIKAGVTAIIGHATSGQTMAALEVTNPAKVVLLSPTVSTPELSGQEDCFFRVYPSFKDSARSFAQYTYKRDGIKRIAVIYDMDNYTYVKAYGSAFTEEFQSAGGRIADEVGFSSSASQNILPLLSRLQRNNAEGILILASDIDTALVAQRIRLIGWDVPLYTSAWAQTEALISNGGGAVEGLKLEQSYALESKTPRFIEFQSQYRHRFGSEPSFGAAFGYEAALVLAEALEKTGGKPEGLCKALTETSDFQGLIDTFSIDRFGDVERPFYLSTIQNGKFTVIQKLTLDNSERE